MEDPPGEGVLSYSIIGPHNKAVVRQTDSLMPPKLLRFLAHLFFCCLHVDCLRHHAENCTNARWKFIFLYLHIVFSCDVLCRVLVPSSNR